ncbi:hypothetical protein ACFXHA_10655 [Nocardia sp. NPDC059240]|uniref:hypothetical protein n=1 Tax=Nocardia sp. NPDC059240 TaxID=3346786 RepID=UPI0036CDDA4B
MKGGAVRVVTALALAGMTIVSGCSIDSSQAADSPEQAVRDHIKAADAGDVVALRRLACGGLAEQMTVRSDEQVRTAFDGFYKPTPDKFSASAPAGDSVRVLGFYTGLTDLDIAFVTEQHGRWQVCGVARGNGGFGPLPGPFK